MVKSNYSPKDAKGLWVYLERDNNKLEGVSIELIGKGKELSKALGTSLTAFVLGHEVNGLAQEAVEFGADTVIIADSPQLVEYSTEAYSEVMYDLIMQHRPDIVLLGGTKNGADLAGRVAVRLRCGLTAHCTSLEISKNGFLVGWVPGFGGGIEAAVESPQHRPQMATVRPGVFPMPAKGPSKGKIVFVHPTIKCEIKSRRIESVRHKGSAVDLTKSKYIVAAGRGINGDASKVKELAKLIRADVGATRVVVDEGWLPRETMIGQTGVVTRPKLVITGGISGAVQFTVGVSEAERIVAINTDPEAPIFEQADVCVVGDANTIMEKLAQQIKKGKGV